MTTRKKPTNCKELKVSVTPPQLPLTTNTGVRPRFLAGTDLAGWEGRAGGSLTRRGRERPGRTRKIPDTDVREGGADGLPGRDRRGWDLHRSHLHHPGRRH